MAKYFICTQTLSMQTGTRKNRFFSARAGILWNELDEETVTVDMVDKFKRKLSEFGY